MDSDIIDKLNKLSDSELTELQTLLKITPDMCIHTSKKPIYKLQQKNYTQLHGMKPSGLWYGFGKEWIDCVESRMSQWKSEYLYEVNINNSNILQIKDYSELISFTKNYTSIIKSQFIDYSYYIDWNKVSSEYDGIEINPYIRKARLELLWYYGWDVASGCVWNLDNITLEQV